MPAPRLNVIVTGANRGLGFAIVKQLSEDASNKPMLILACARKPPPTSNLAHHDQVELQWHSLDIANPKSIQDFASLVRDECPEGVDVLINNAGVNLDTTNDHGIDSARQTMRINYDGTAAMTETFIPLMRRPAHPALHSHSRIINVSSVGSKLSAIPSNALRKAIRNASSMSEIQDLRSSYLESLANSTTGSRAGSSGGWPGSNKSYCVSKALINATTQVFAAENPDLLINACCPGWCQTDMGSLVGPPSKSAAEGARIPMKLAFGDVGVSGAYWENASVHGKGDGEIAEWYVEGGS